jgi:hypothetical protein
MKKMNQAVLLLVIVLLFSALSACQVFDGTEDSMDDSSAIEASTVDSSGSDSADQEKSPVFQEITVSAADKAANMDKFVGNWIDQSDSSRYATIEKTDIGYTYTDNESTNPAEVKDGVLQIHIEVDNAIATGKYDEATGILTISYQGQEAQFKKKE